AYVPTLLGYGDNRELSVILAGVTDFIRQRGRHPVEPIPLLFARVFRRPVEERMIASNRSAYSNRRPRLGGQQRIPERARPHPRTRELAGQLVTRNQSGRQPLDTPDARQAVGPGATDDVDDAA